MLSKAKVNLRSPPKQLPYTVTAPSCRPRPHARCSHLTCAIAENASTHWNIDRWLEEWRNKTQNQKGTKVETEISISTWVKSWKCLNFDLNLMEKNCHVWWMLPKLFPDQSINGDREFRMRTWRKKIFFSRIFPLDKIKQEIDIWICSNAMHCKMNLEILQKCLLLHWHLFLKVFQFYDSMLTFHILPTHTGSPTFWDFFFKFYIDFEYIFDLLKKSKVLHLLFWPPFQFWFFKF